MGPRDRQQQGQAEQTVGDLGAGLDGLVDNDARPRRRTTRAAAHKKPGPQQVAADLRDRQQPVDGKPDPRDDGQRAKTFPGARLK